SLLLASTTLNGPGTLTNAASIVLRNSVINATLINQGTLSAFGNSASNGNVTTLAGSTIHIEGNSSIGNTTLSFASGFTNNGLIEMTTQNDGYAVTLSVTSGTLVNSSTGVINS